MAFPDQDPLALAHLRMRPLPYLIFASRWLQLPLYLGLIALDLGLALLWPSFWAVALLPAGVATLWWGSILPEERYLSEKFGAEYEAYRARVRRWL